MREAGALKKSLVDALGAVYSFSIHALLSRFLDLKEVFRITQKKDQGRNEF